MTATSLHVGSHSLGYRPSSIYGGAPRPITLGTAMAISGAAASPNMGYHSSPIVTFLMTLFNARLGWWLEKHGHEDTPRSRLLVFLVLGRGQTPDQIDGLFSGRKFEPDVLTDDERKLLDKLKGNSIDHPDMPDEVRGECPPWAADTLRRRFGGEFAREMAACLTPPPLDLRVNPVKSTREIMLGALRALGLDAEPLIEEFNARYAAAPWELDDDVMFPDHLERTVALLDAGWDVVAVDPYAEMIDRTRALVAERFPAAVTRARLVRARLEDHAAEIPEHHRSHVQIVGGGARNPLFGAVGVVDFQTVWADM